MRWFALVLIAGAVGCRSERPAAPPSPTADAGPPARCVFRYALPEPPGSIDPAFVRSGLENLVAPNLFEGLMNFPEADGAPVPGVAERHTVSADGRTYTFHLRGDALWSDGRPVVAADFVYAWRRVLEPATAAPYADILYAIDGARAFHGGRTTDFSTVGVRARDARTLVVRLERPTPWFPELTAFFTYLPVPRRAIEAHGERWTRPEHIVTNGPFRLIGHEPSTGLVMAKDPNHWDAARVGVDRLEVLFINDGATAVNLIDTGRLDWTGLVDLPPVQIPRLSRRPDFRADPWLATHYLRLNTRRPPFDDPRVRRAVAHGIDRSAVAVLARGGRRPARGFVPPMPGRPAVDGPGFDADKARALLAEAGYGPDRPLTFRLHYPHDELRRLLAQLVAAQLEKHLGARVDLWTEEFRVYLRTQDAGNYEMSLSRWAGDYTDPTTFLEMWTTGALHNKTGWSAAAYDRLLAKSRGELDAKARAALLDEAERLVLADAPIVPVLYGARAFLLRRGVRGIGVNALGNHLMRYVACAAPATQPGGRP